MFGFCLFSTNVIQAYIQGTENFHRYIFINPRADFNLGPDEPQQPLSPLYGLSESGDYLGRTLREHPKKDIEMKSSIFDPALFYKQLDNTLEGICAA